ncbi:hypothetical protein G4G27_01165 [Sphingomonas sp. So64.6b]|uniref:hypothetical protein n=1 Tax=Sphingomonas sp. So64.6b TaxID=2997354 RepID=UPI001600DBCF|nr:hypothetical protein [Sphingomonas sp. So64.6b]QNA82772.1 hypothetical protein G4G27_01165 [Sphingomonas sp. So64.6b]
MMILTAWAALAVVPVWLTAPQGSSIEPGTSVDTEACRLIPPDTAIEIEVVDAVQSRTAKIGDKFTIRLSAPLVIDGKALLPVGTPGIGEVIHATHVRFMTNKPGELIVAARYLNLKDARLPLRGLRINRAGINGYVYSSVAGPIAIANNTDIPAGSTAVAKVAGSCVVTPGIAEQQGFKK